MKVTSSVVETALNDCGISYDLRGGEYWAHCPQHLARTGKEDRNPSWSINAESGAHMCFSCGYRGNLYTLVRDVKGEGVASQYANQVEEFGRSGDTLDASAVRSKVQSLMNRRRVKPEKGVPRTYLAAFSPEIPEWALASRRLTAESCARYDVRWDPTPQTWIMPFWHPRGHLLGWQRKAEQGRLFRNEPREMAKAETVFGLPAVTEEPRIVVVESPLDAVMLHSKGFPAVALAGSRASDEQVAILSEFRVVLALDNDRAGAIETTRLTEVFPRAGVEAIYLDYKGLPFKDLGETPNGYIRALLRRHFP